MRPLLSLAVLCCALVLGACGNTEELERRNAYVGAVNSARQTFDREVAEVTGRLRETATSARTRDALDDLKAAADRFEQQLRGLSPPPAVAGLHARFADNVAAYGERFETAKDGFRTQNPKRYLEARTALQRDVAVAGERLNAVIDELNAQLQQQ